MARHIVDLSARSQLVRAQPLLSHAWVTSASDVLLFLRQPRAELKKLGIRLPSECRIETVLENHDWLAGHSGGFGDGDGVAVFCRGSGDGRSFYRVSVYASKATDQLPERELLHRIDEERRPARPMPAIARARVELTRRSMLAAPIHHAADRFLVRLTMGTPTTKSADEAHRIFVAITETIARLVATKPALREAMGEVAATLQRPFNPAYELLFRTYRRPHATLHGELMSALYANALNMFRTSGWHYDRQLRDVVELLDDPRPAIEILLAALRSVDPDWHAHLTVESAVRRRDDRFLDEKLVEAEKLFASHHEARADSLARFATHKRGFRQLALANASESWFLPSMIAFAISVWPESPETSTAEAVKKHAR